MKKIVSVILLFVSLATAKEFSSPAAEKSFHREGDVRSLTSDAELANLILKGKKGMTFGARSAGCSTRCSTSCSTSCSTTCSTRCASTPTIYIPSVRTSETKKKTTPTPRIIVDSQKETTSPTEIVVTERKDRYEIFWDDSAENVVHNMSCKSFARCKGKPRLQSKLPDCKTCGGQSKRPFEVGEIRISPKED